MSVVCICGELACPVVAPRVALVVDGIGLRVVRSGLAGIVGRVEVIESAGDLVPEWFEDAVLNDRNRLGGVLGGFTIEGVGGGQGCGETSTG